MEGSSILWRGVGSHAGDPVSNSTIKNCLKWFQRQSRSSRAAIETEYPTLMEEGMGRDAEVLRVKASLAIPMLSMIG